MNHCCSLTQLELKQRRWICWLKFKIIVSHFLEIIKNIIYIFAKLGTNILVFEILSKIFDVVVAEVVYICTLLKLVCKISDLPVNIRWVYSPIFHYSDISMYWQVFKQKKPLNRAESLTFSLCSVPSVWLYIVYKGVELKWSMKPIDLVS